MKTTTRHWTLDGVPRIEIITTTDGPDGEYILSSENPAPADAKILTEAEYGKAVAERARRDAEFLAKRDADAAAAYGKIWDDKAKAFDGFNERQIIALLGPRPSLPDDQALPAVAKTRGKLK